MAFYMNKIVNLTYEEAIKQTSEALMTEGFGIVSEIQLHQKMKEKLGVDFRRYTIFGACNPQFAYKAITVEDKMGVLMPCNVVVQELAPGRIDVSLINPKEAMQVVNNKDISCMAGEITDRLMRVLQKIGV